MKDVVRVDGEDDGDYDGSEEDIFFDADDLGKQAKEKREEKKKQTQKQTQTQKRTRKLTSSRVHTMRWKQTQKTRPM